MNKDSIIAGMYRRFRIEIQFEDQVRGGVPKNPDTVVQARQE